MSFRGAWIDKNSGKNATTLITTPALLAALISP